MTTMMKAKLEYGETKMAIFDKNKVICGINAEKAEIGKKYWFADRIGYLEEYVEGIKSDDACILKRINNHPESSPFVNEKYTAWEFIYPCEEPEEVWYVYKALGTENSYTMKTTVLRMPREFEGTKEECEKWIEDHEVTSEELVQYVPFDTVEELIECWNNKRFNGKPPYNTKLEKPLIWIKHNKDIFLITKFKDNTVSFCNVFWDMEDLFEQCTFLDGSLIGKLKD